jgi:hypothetical protein
MDSSVSLTYGDQEGMAYNGHFGCTCYHPLFLFNHMGNLERCRLRPGNVHSAAGWRDVLEPVVEHYKERKVRLYFRGDAAFASPDLYEYLKAEGMLYAIRLPANKVLQDGIAQMFAATLPVSAIRPDRGTENAVWSPRSNGIPANCIPASASSSPISAVRPNG